jgi:carboxymethylenebutenolidase
MPSQATEIRTADGTCPAYAAWPASGGPAPAVLLLMDGIGYRPVLQAKADRLAAAGYYALVPNLFYRRPGEPRLPGAQLLQPENRPLLTELVQTLTPDVVLRDAAAFLDHLASRPEVAAERRFGVVGYCMGGSMAVRVAAAFPQRIGVAASFHAGRLVTDAPTSPHRLVSQIEAELYFGHADRDPGMTPAQVEALQAALQAAGSRYASELYAGALHGFTMPDLPVYDAAACARHWERLLGLLGSLSRP